MLLWFAGVSVVVVWAVFRSPSLDYRLVALGAVLPVGEVAFGGPYLLHTLLGAAALLFALVLLTRGRRLLRRRFIGLPIGVMLHLALDATWARAELFWWPFLGGAPLGSGGLPELDHSLGVLVALDVVGLVCLVWFWRRFGLADPGRRQRFLRTGQLGREVVG